MHDLYTHHSYYTGTWQGNVGRFFYDFYGIGKYEAWFFFFKKNKILHVVRHPADSDGRPTAGAQVLVRVSMIP